MKSSCPTRPQLQRLLADQLDADADAALTRHVETCPACQAMLVELSSGGEARECSAANATEVAEEIMQRLKSRLPETNRAGKRNRAHLRDPEA